MDNNMEFESIRCITLPPDESPSLSFRLQPPPLCAPASAMQYWTECYCQHANRESFNNLSLTSCSDSLDFHQLPEILSISQNSTVRFTSQEPLCCMFFCDIFVLFFSCICDSVAPGFWNCWFSCKCICWCVKKKVIWMLFQCYTNINHLLYHLQWYCSYGLKPRRCVCLRELYCTSCLWRVPG